MSLRREGCIILQLIELQCNLRVVRRGYAKLDHARENRVFQVRRAKQGFRLFRYFFQQDLQVGGLLYAERSE